MLTYPHLDAIALNIGPLKVHWYGLMYLLAFVFAWFLATMRIKGLVKKELHTALNLHELENFIFYCALGVVIGGRLGHVFFYGWYDWFNDPLMPFKVWQGGMSFHGGLIGVAVAAWIFAKKYKKDFWNLTDFVAPIVPIGLALGRVGNFINGELWGRVTDVPWAMVFPYAGPLPRHPSQVYEFLLEGVLLFSILWIYSLKPRPRKAVSAWFLFLYGVFRFGVEFFRAPDQPWGFIWHYFSMGQLLSVPMIIIGVGLLISIYRTCSSK